jgi:FMN phosphatase YigB (HAD superfamily)/DNA-binding XRE family transcriptional regulator
MNDGESPVTASFDELALGKAIQAARRSAGLTQQELCERLDISYSTLTKIERGAIKSPSIFTVAQIAQICGISIEALIGISPLVSSTVPLPITTSYKKALNGIEFVYFDINGCMVRFFQRAFSELAQETGTKPELIEDTFWHYNDAVCRGEMPLEEFNKVLGERVGKRDLSWSDYYLRNVDLIAEMHECAKWASQHYKIGLLSNIMPGFIDTMISDGLLPNLPYSSIIDSSVVGAIKPEPTIYQLAEKQSGSQAKDILLVDDSRTNLMSAERMGWHVLWFDDFSPTESVSRIKSTLEF